MERLPMKSINFEFLRNGWDDLGGFGGFGGFAEAYAHNDPHQQAAIWLPALNGSECYYNDERDPGSAPA